MRMFWMVFGATVRPTFRWIPLAARMARSILMPPEVEPEQPQDPDAYVTRFEYGGYYFPDFYDALDAAVPILCEIFHADPVPFENWKVEAFLMRDVDAFIDKAFSDAIDECEYQGG